MKALKISLTVFMTLFIVSCSKSKEEKFIEDFEEFVETFETSNYNDLIGVGDQMLKTFESKMDKLYGIDINKSDQIIDCVESSDLKLNDDQKEKVINLQERMIKRMGELMKDKEAPKSSGISSSDSIDWDALLQSYEEYVDEYISFVKKAANGDMDALTEYPALMEKAQEFSVKMQNAQNDMSTSQWTRYNKITTKMLKAAQEMQ